MLTSLAKKSNQTQQDVLSYGATKKALQCEIDKDLEKQINLYCKVKRAFSVFKISFETVQTLPNYMSLGCYVPLITGVKGNRSPVPHSLLPDTAPTALVLPESELFTKQRLVPGFHVQKGAPSIVLQKSTQARWLSTTLSAMSFPP